MPRSGSLRRDLLAADLPKASIERGTYTAVHTAATSYLRRKELGKPIGGLPPSALRPLIRTLHRKHRRSGGAIVLPDLAALTTHQLQQLARRLQSGRSAG